MPNNRDDFTEKTKDRLAKRVGYRCSNPNCRKLTCGASQKPDGYVNIGVAAHICAAAPGGKRYDPNMTAKQRKSILNGIWLCQSCSKLIDSDEIRYTEELLHQWKYDAETESVKQLEGNSIDGIALYAANDIAKLKFDYSTFAQLQNLLNREINQLMAMMESIHQKLDAAKIEEDSFLVWAYEERLQTLTSSYASMNERLRNLAAESRNAELHVLGEKTSEDGTAIWDDVSYDLDLPCEKMGILRLLASLVFAAIAILVAPIFVAVRWIITAIRPKQEQTNPVIAMSEPNQESHLDDMLSEIQAVRRDIGNLASEVDALHLDRIHYERTVVDVAWKTPQEK